MELEGICNNFRCKDGSKIIMEDAKKIKQYAKDKRQ